MVDGAPRQAAARDSVRGRSGVTPERDSGAQTVSEHRDRGDAAPSHNLPVQLTSFVGRADDVGDVVATLSSNRLITLLGPGGVGKTRLAFEVAAAALEAYPDGVWMTDLSAVTDPDLVASEVTAAMGVSDRGGPSNVERLIEVLARRRALIVLDNCEHLTTACAEVARGVLLGCPDVTVLATSREPLAVAGELRWLVPTLESSDAANLFVERARLRRPAFTVTQDNAHWIAEICTALDGIPLALELAAALTGGLSVAQIAERLDDRLGLLATDVGGAADRQRTLRGAFDWSFDLLSPSERELFVRLSIFPGSFSLRGAEQVCAGDDIERADVVGLLLRLVDRSLVSAEPHRATMRYRLLETARQYAWEKLNESAVGPEGCSVFRREADYWTLAYGPTEFRLKHSVGLGYLHVLLSKAGRELHALELTGSAAVGSSTEDVLLDSQARAAYRQRLADLTEDREEAVAFNDPERAARADEEIEALVQQLAGAVGISGRARTTSSAAERARMSVRQAVASAIKRIDAASPELARHLERSLRTGTYCSYMPEAPVDWEL